MSKLDLKNELAALDGKDRDFYDSLTEDERKKFSAYILLKYGANVDGSRDLQEYYLLSANEQNRNFWDLNRHPKLQWLSVSAISPGVGNMRHYWLKSQKSDSDNKMLKRLAEIFPDARPDELKILELINTEEDIKQYDQQCGNDAAVSRSRKSK